MAAVTVELAELEVVGSQVPTFMWCPPFDTTLGDEAAKLYEEATRPTGTLLDPWQKLALQVAFALDAHGAMLCFEVAIVLSRQNGKGEFLIALELAWLFLFGERLVTHSAHLFETSREHFLKMQLMIQLNPEFDRRVMKMREGRGAEEIILRGAARHTLGARLKFMSRKGGAGRGFTGGKMAADEAMYLDADMMAAGLPTMATRPDAQVIYTGSAGMKHSTQLAHVRSRGRRPLRGLPGDPALAYMEWAAEKAVYDERTGQLVRGDDPADPRTWAKVNPAAGAPPRGRITISYIRKEANALGGFDSVQFGTERLGIGDWPEDDDRWEVVDKVAWKNAEDVLSVMKPAGRVFAVHADDATGLYVLSVSGLREDGRGHVETVDRLRGSALVVERLAGIVGSEVRKAVKKPPVILLKAGSAYHLAHDLEVARWVVHTPTETEYNQGCAALAEEIRRGLVVHIGQGSLTKGMGAAAKRSNTEGGWHWDQDQPGQAPVVAATLARWGVRKGLGKLPRSKVF